MGSCFGKRIKNSKVNRSLILKKFMPNTDKIFSTKILPINAHFNGESCNHFHNNNFERENIEDVMDETLEKKKDFQNGFDFATTFCKQNEDIANFLTYINNSIEKRKDFCNTQIEPKAVDYAEEDVESHELEETKHKDLGEQEDSESTCSILVFQQEQTQSSSSFCEKNVEKEETEDAKSCTKEEDALEMRKDSREERKNSFSSSHDLSSLNTVDEVDFSTWCQEIKNESTILTTFFDEKCQKEENPEKEIKSISVSHSPIPQANKAFFNKVHPPSPIMPEDESTKISNGELPTANFILANGKEESNECFEERIMEEILENISSSNWKVKCKAMDSIRNIIQVSNSSLLIPEISTIIKFLTTEIKSIRSAVSKEAINTLNSFIKGVGNEIQNPELNEIVLTLLNKSVDCNNFISQSTEDCLKTLSLNCEMVITIQALSQVGLKHKNSKSRRLASKTIVYIVKLYDSSKHSQLSLFGKSKDEDRTQSSASIFSSLLFCAKKSCLDSCPFTRYFGREMLLVLKNDETFEKVLAKSSTEVEFREIKKILHNLDIKGKNIYPTSSSLSSASNKVANGASALSFNKKGGKPTHFTNGAAKSRSNVKLSSSAKENSKSQEQLQTMLNGQEYSIVSGESSISCNGKNNSGKITSPVSRVSNTGKHGNSTDSKEKTVSLDFTLFKMRDGDVQERQEALNDFHVLLKRHKSFKEIEQNFHKVIHCLAPRIVDTNPKLQQSSILALRSITELSKQCISQSLSTLLPNVIFCLTSKNKDVEEQSSKLIDIWILELDGTVLMQDFVSQINDGSVALKTRLTKKLAALANIMYPKYSRFVKSHVIYILKDLLGIISTTGSIKGGGQKLQESVSALAKVLHAHMQADLFSEVGRLESSMEKLLEKCVYE